MSPLSEHTGNGNPHETSLQREDTKEQLDVLPSRFDRLLFQHIYVYMIGLLFVAKLLTVISLLGRNSPVEEVLLAGIGFGVPPTVATILAIWRFNVWRGRTPNTLRDLWEHKRIALPNGDADLCYLCLLERYRAALASPKRYVLSGFAMIFICIPFVFQLTQALSSEPSAIEVVGGFLYVFLFLGGFYCIGILTWAISLSGWYVRNLVRAFKLNIRPFHPDQSGGLKLLGNFCFGLASPPLIASGLFIGYSLFALVVYSPQKDGSAYLVLNVYYPLLFVLLFALPTIVLGFMLPLREIHATMVSEAKTNENRYFTRTEALREEIQALIDVKQVEAAKAVQEERALVEALYAPYPTWPFHVSCVKVSKALLNTCVACDESSGGMIASRRLLMVCCVCTSKMPSILLNIDRSRMAMGTRVNTRLKASACAR